MTSPRSTPLSGAARRSRRRRRRAGRLEVADERVHDPESACSSRASPDRVQRGRRTARRGTTRATGRRQPPVRPRRRTRRALRRRPRADIDVDGQEAAGERTRHAAGACDRRHQRMAVLDRRHSFAIRDMIDPPGTETTDRACGRRRRASPARIAAGADRLHTSHLGLDADERRDLTGIASDDRHALPRSRIRFAVSRPVPGRAAPTGSRTIGMPLRVRCPPRLEHRLDPVGGERADVQDERARERDHLLHLLRGVRHHGQCAERESGVRGLVHHDVIGDLVDERLRRAKPSSDAPE